MAFHPKGQSRERILAVGGAGTGKTTAWLNIAKRCPESTFFVLDTEPSQAVARALETDFPELGNVEYSVAWEWDEYTESLRQFKAGMGPNDWLIVDLLAPAWEAVQQWYIERIFGKQVDEFWVTAREANKKGSPLDGYKDWGVINKVYNAWAGSLIRSPGHVYCTAPVEPISLDNDAKDIKTLFGPYGVKPRGQKHTAHLFHTVMWFQAPRPGEWQLTTIKDRGRELLQAAPCTDFSVSYLMKVAGWRP